MSLGGLLDRRVDLFVGHDTDTEELRHRALCRLGALDLPPGGTILLQCASPEAFLELFWAGVLGGLTVASVPLAKSATQERRVKLLRQRLDARVVTDEVPLGRPADPRPEADEPLLQFSSGSTGEPTGVVLTADNLLANLADLTRRAGMGPDDRGLYWMPLTHDMGLVGSHLGLLYAGASQRVYTPTWFLRDPVRWLRTAEEHGCTLLTATSHALAMTLDRHPRVDLSHVRRLFLGAEPVRAEVVERAIAELGLAPDAVYPVYGLAEGGVGLSFPEGGTAPVVREIAGRRLVGVGQPLDSVQLDIVDPDEHGIGRIVFDGPNRTRALWRAQREPVDGPLDTGDLGAMVDGTLFIAGRAKELAILGGVNVWLPDVDAVVSAAIGAPAASARVDTAHGEGVAVFVKRRAPLTEGERAAIRSAVLRELEVPLASVQAVRALPKTPSGKVRRHALVRWELEPVVAAARAHLGWELDADTPLAELPSIAMVDLAAHLSSATGRPVHVADLLAAPSLRALLRGTARDVGPLPLDEPVAIVGMGARVAGADGLPALWAALVAGDTAIGPLPASREADVRAVRGRCDAPVAGWLDDVASFDAAAFGLEPRDAAWLHPAHRVFLEVADAALADAGGVRGRVGVFTGHHEGPDRGDYREVVEALAPEQLGLAVTGTIAPFLAARLAWQEDWRGPVVSVDTACSASLVAVHLACRALRDGECDVALAGAARVCALPDAWPVRMGFESASGTARPFDRRADGMVLGEGAGVVVLKRLADAERDGDAIHAVIVGSAVNHDGRGAALTVPNPDAQVEVVRRAWARAGGSDGLAFIEAHGAGTRLSDPVELEALRRALGPAQVPVGSIKGNIGHLFEAAGVLGLIKAALALSHRTLPASGGLDSPLPSEGFAPATAPTPLSHGPLRAGVTSLGLSGTNAHVVLQSAAPRALDAPPERRRVRCWPTPPPPGAGLFAALERFLGRAVDERTRHTRFVDMGLDSIALVQLGQRLREHTGRGVPLQRLLDDLATPAALEAWLADPAMKPIGPPDAAPPTAGTVDPTPTVAAVLAKTPTSRALAERDRPALANNRAVAGFRADRAAMIYPIVATRAEGAWIEDVDGHRYLDLTMGFGVHLLGHGFATHAVRDALHLPLGPMTSGAGEVARRLAALTGVERAAFFPTGTEAVTVAMRLARTRTARPLVARFAGSYHGSNDSLLAVEGPGGTLPGVAGVTPTAVSDTLVVPWARPRALDALWERRDQLAAVLVEPVQSRRPGLHPRAFLEELQHLTREMGAALVFDEVITGFRAHPAGAAGLWGLQPDLRVYGKVLGGGLPLGVVAGDAAWMDGIDGGPVFGEAARAETTFVAGTYCHHPLAMAAAIAVLDALEADPTLPERLSAATATLCARLDALFEARDAPWRTSRFASMFRIEGDDLLFARLLLEGIYVWEGRTCFWSAAHTDTDADLVVAAVERSLDHLGCQGVHTRAGRQAVGAALEVHDPERVARAHGLALVDPDDLDELDAAPSFALRHTERGVELHTHRRWLDGWSMGVLLRELASPDSPTPRASLRPPLPSPSTACHPAVCHSARWPFTPVDALAGFAGWMRDHPALDGPIGVPVAGQPALDPDAVGQLSRHVHVPTGDPGALPAAIDRGTHALGHTVVFNLDRAPAPTFAVPQPFTAYDLVVNLTVQPDGSTVVLLKARADRFTSDDLAAWERELCQALQESA